MDRMILACGLLVVPLALYAINLTMFRWLALVGHRRKGLPARLVVMGLCVIQVLPAAMFLVLVDPAPAVVREESPNHSNEPGEWHFRVNTSTSFMLAGRYVDESRTRAWATRAYLFSSLPAWALARLLLIPLIVAGGEVTASWLSFCLFLLLAVMHWYCWGTWVLWRRPTSKAVVDSRKQSGETGDPTYR